MTSSAGELPEDALDLLGMYSKCQLHNQRARRGIRPVCAMVDDAIDRSINRTGWRTIEIERKLGLTIDGWLMADDEGQSEGRELPDRRGFWGLGFTLGEKGIFFSGSARCEEETEDLGIKRGRVQVGILIYLKPVNHESAMRFMWPHNLHRPHNRPVLMDRSIFSFPVCFYPAFAYATA